MPASPLSSHDYGGIFGGHRVLITGGAGFIGSHLAARLQTLGASVVVLDDLSGGYRENLPAGVELRVASVTEGAVVRAAAEGCRYVFHEAAMVSVPQSVDDPHRCFQVNVIGTERVLSAARDAAQRVLFAASAAAYGPDPTLPSREDQVPACVSPYAASKVAAEHMLTSFSHCYDLSTVSLRYFNIFGPRQDPGSAYAAAISAFARRLTSGGKPTVFGDGGQTRDFTYIDNVVHANLLAAACPRQLQGEVMNIGTGRRISLLDVLEHMGRALGVDATPEHGPVRAGDVRDSVADISQARELIDYEPIVDFEDGIATTVKWMAEAYAGDNQTQNA